MLFRRKDPAFKKVTNPVLNRGVFLAKRLNMFMPPARYVSRRVILAYLDMVERYMPDKLLLFFINTLDTHVPTKAVDFVIDRADQYVPHRMRIFLIAFADQCVPDTVGDFRKVSSFIAGFGKYIPDRVIPQDSIDNWLNIKLKLHIPTLLSRGREKAHR